MKFKNILTLILGIILLSSCDPSLKNEKTSPSLIFYGGEIITMVGDSPEYIEALAIRDGKILFVGSKGEAIIKAGENVKMLDLKGKTLLPGFIDPHSHFINSLGMSTQANCSPSPVGNANNVEGVLKALRELKKRQEYSR